MHLETVFFFLLGVLIYSFFFWITDQNFSQVFGMILVGVTCNILYKLDFKMSSEKVWIKTKDIIYLCAGAVFDSLSNGFPFSYLK